MQSENDVPRLLRFKDLQARGKDWRLAYNCLLLRSARTPDDYKARCDANTRLQGRVGLVMVMAGTNYCEAR